MQIFVPVIILLLFTEIFKLLPSIDGYPPQFLVCTGSFFNSIWDLSLFAVIADSTNLWDENLTYTDVWNLDYSTEAVSFLFLIVIFLLPFRMSSTNFIYILFIEKFYLFFIVISIFYNLFNVLSNLDNKGDFDTIQF